MHKALSANCLVASIDLLFGYLFYNHFDHTLLNGMVGAVTGTVVTILLCIFALPYRHEETDPFSVYVFSSAFTYLFFLVSAASICCFPGNGIAIMVFAIFFVFGLIAWVFAVLIASTYHTNHNLELTMATLPIIGPSIFGLTFFQRRISRNTPSLAE